MVEASAQKLRLLNLLRNEKRALDYFSGWQHRVILEMVADAWIKPRRNGVRTLEITRAGRNVLKANGART
jgi:hypothetical protein